MDRGDCKKDDVIYILDPILQSEKKTTCFYVTIAARMICLFGYGCLGMDVWAWP